MGPTIPAPKVRGAELSKMGACRFCGQTYMINVISEEAEEDFLDEQATLTCKCDDAMHYTKFKKVEEKIERILSDCSEDAVEISKEALRLVEAGSITSAKINVGCISIAITISSKGDVKLKKTIKTEKELKI